MLRNCTFEGRMYFNGFSTTTVLFREGDRERTEQTHRGGGGLRRPLRGSRKPYFPGGFLIASPRLMSREFESKPRLIPIMIMKDGHVHGTPSGSLAHAAHGPFHGHGLPPVSRAVPVRLRWRGCCQWHGSRSSNLKLYIAPSPSGRWEEKICVRRREFSQPCYLIFSFSIFPSTKVKIWKIQRITMA